MFSTALELVGREDELGAIASLLDDVEQLPRVAVLAGEAGIGKTTVWVAARDAARARGYRVLSSRPSEAETSFSYAGLTDLLGSVAGEVAPQLPPIQRRALDAAMLLGETDIVADDRVVAASFLGALRVLADDGPVCLAVDDLQWLDPASLAALRFALARTDGERVGSLLAVRGETPDWLQRAVPEDRLHTVSLNGLSVGAIHELLRDRFDMVFARPTLIRIWETSKGNPFIALELAGALVRKGGTLGVGADLPISSDLDVLLRARLDGLGSGALEVARTAAALAEPTVALVQAATGDGSDDALGETLQKRILELEGDRLRFSHPLLASAVAARDTPTRRRALHARLAKLVPTAEERARHLALSTAEPDTQIAEALETAARSARDRGAPAAAAELAEQALRLTPPEESTIALRRLALAAELHNAAGDTARAVGMLDRAHAGARPGVERATIVVRLAELEAEPRAAEALYEAALAEATTSDELVARIHLDLAALMRWGAGLGGGVEHTELAMEAAARVEDPALACRAVAANADWRFRAGRGIARVALEEALTVEETLTDWPLAGGPAEVLAHNLAWSADLEDARALTVRCSERFEKRNDARGVASAFWNLAFIGWRAGRWQEAARDARSSNELDEQLGGVPHAGTFPTAIIAAHRGQVDEARALARAAIERGSAAGVAIEVSGHSWILGFVELSLGDAATALPHLRRAYDVRNDFMLEPAMRLELGDLTEALIATGELDGAEAILDAWEPRSVALDRAWALAILARGRGLLLAARGDLDGALARFARADAEHARSEDPFQHARTVLALGRVQRRGKQRGAARLTLESALDRFETIGAPLWADQARAELARIGGRAPSRDDLTESERRVAQLVAEGRSNKEVAAALFLTAHSVETTLTRVYRKLGIRRRSELAHRLSPSE